MLIRELFARQGGLIPLQRNKLMYDILGIGIYTREYKEQFDINEAIYEGLEKSYPRQDVIARLKQKFGVYVYPDQLDPSNILFQLDLRSLEIRKVNVQQIFQFITQQGWFISLIQIEDNDEFNGDDPQAIQTLVNGQYDKAVITIEALHGVEHLSPKILYHATLLQVWKTKIKPRGLSPRSQSTLSKHPDRVYFTKSVNSAILFAREAAQQKLIVAKKGKYDLSKFNPEEYYKHWVVLEIDTSKIPHIRSLSYFRVHEDPNMPKGHTLYSQNYVSPAAIRFIKQFDAY